MFPAEESQEPDTLKILHLPSNLSDERRKELFQRYGAVKTVTVRQSNKYSPTFVKFSTHDAAKEAFLRLHQLKVKGRYLSVEFAKKPMPTDLSQSEGDQQNTSKEEIQEKTVDKRHFQTFLRKLYGWTTNQMFTQPPSPSIKYKYAPPNKSIIFRIAIQLFKEPAFYTQVLHLMNRMNLPPPFEELEAEFPLLKEIYDIEKYKDIFEKDITKMEEEILANIEKKDTEREKEEEEEEESEIESDTEQSANSSKVIPVKRKLPQSGRRPKIRKFVNPNKQVTPSSSVQKSVKPEEMFEPIQRGEVKSLRIELKTVDKLLSTDTNNDKPVEDDTTVIPEESGFGLIFPAVKPTESLEEHVQSETKQVEFITTEELAANRISINDQRLLPVFKNYHAGKPTNRLYIKNLAKQVEESDLHYIYRKYVILESEKVEQAYSIRLMQEGRMKGQAFISLQNTAQAQLALEETNGFLLKGKPMVVQFAKGSNISSTIS